MQDSRRVRSVAPRASAIVATLAVLLAACGGDSSSAPEPFEGTPTEQMQEVLDRQAARGIEPYAADLDTLVGLYGDGGGSLCENAADEDLAAILSAGAALFDDVGDPSTTFRQDAIVVEVYCPESLDDYADAVQEVRGFDPRTDSR